jgi:salicylate hydroxylase
VGAGIQVSPNLSRIANAWGLGPILDQNAVRLRAIIVKRWQDGNLLVVAPAMPKIEEVHGAPQYVVHRPELLNTFLEGGLALPTVTLRTNSHVETVDFDAPSVTLRGGETCTADVVIAADGLKSVCRARLFKKLGLIDKARPTGDAAYRIVIPAESLLADSVLKHLIVDDPVGYHSFFWFANEKDPIYWTRTTPHGISD